MKHLILIGILVVIASCGKDGFDPNEALLSEVLHGSWYIHGRYVIEDECFGIEKFGESRFEAYDLTGPEYPNLEIDTEQGKIDRLLHTFDEDGNYNSTYILIAASDIYFNESTDIITYRDDGVDYDVKVMMLNENEVVFEQDIPLYLSAISSLCTPVLYRRIE